MILVPNRLLPLNGNKFFILTLICSLLVFSACGSLKKDTSPNKTQTQKDKPKKDQEGKVYNPNTGKYEDPKEQDANTLDTVQWTDVPVDKNPPIVNEENQDSKSGKEESETLNVYDVAVCLPFLGNRFESYKAEIDDKSMLAINFYSGVKLAFEDLSLEGIRLNVKVMDTEASDSKMRTLLASPELANAEMIVGPVKSTNLRATADFAKKNKKVLISPLNPSDRITRENPYFVQTSPSLRSHCEAITNHALAQYPVENIVLAVRDKNAEKNRLKYFQDALKIYKRSASTDPFKELIIRDESADLSDLDLMPYIKPDKTTVFIVPSWSNENFIYALLRKISLVKGPHKVVVYGMPQWREFTRIDYDYYERLNVHISSASNIDLRSAKIRNFRTRYFDKYGMVPHEDAFIGYDMMMYFGRMLNKYGTAFQHQLEANSENLLHSEIEFLPFNDGSNIENLDAVDFYENKKVNILKFENYHFQPAN